jgi:hypothetical protein
MHIYSDRWLKSLASYRCLKDNSILPADIQYNWHIFATDSDSGQEFGLPTANTKIIRKQRRILTHRDCDVILARLNQRAEPPPIRGASPLIEPHQYLVTARFIIYWSHTHTLQRLKSNIKIEERTHSTERAPGMVHGAFIALHQAEKGGTVERAGTEKMEVANAGG